MRKIKLKIDGMHCSSCAMNIDMDLEDIDGVKDVRTNYAKGITEVEFDEGKQSVDQLISIIDKTGYNASLSN